jgi:hypothetical protein
MIQTSVKLSGGLPGLSDKRISLNDDGLLTVGQERMQDLGEFAIKTIRNRVAKAIGSDDSPMPPLKVSNRAGFGFTVHGVKRTLSSYPQWKEAHGLQPIRDLTGSGKDGHMLDNLSVRSVSGSSVVMSLTARAARVKALANEKRAPWLSFSDDDTKKIVAYFAQYTGLIVEAIAGRLAQRWKRAA